MNNLSFSLTELNLQVKNALLDYLPETYWVRAETSDVRKNQSGHCYLEFIEKDLKNQNLIARARAVIWANTYTLLSAYFEEQTGQPFTSGLSVLVRVSVVFHELYGYSLSVVDIDPSFTVGEIARNRQLILKQLEADGVISLNKEIEISEIATRIAVISSPTAAGYEDFHDQLVNNSYGFIFYTKLFPAIMQGDLTESSVIAALDRIYEHVDNFDAVVIIRGGGSSSDLSSFDSYELASNCAQFPLPIISGIGHERDITVVDAVAHTRVKTPTAAAEYLINKMTASVSHLYELKQRLIQTSKALIENEQKRIYDISRLVGHTLDIFINQEKSQIKQLTTVLKHYVMFQLNNEKHFIDGKTQYINMVSPENILKRGYTLTLHNGKILKSATQAKVDDTIETKFYDGSVKSVISQK